MIGKLLSLIFPVFILVFVSVANAQTNTSTDSASRLKQQLRDIQAQKKTAISKIKQDAKETKMELRQQIKEAVAAKREAVKEAVATKREEFKARLLVIKGEKKRALVERIDAKLSKVNAKHSDRFAQVLSNLQATLDKMSEDVDKTKAQAAIDGAKTAVEAQAAETYTITISTETALRSDVGAVTSQLRLDLMATHKTVVDAKQAVQALRKDNVIIKKEATSSANL